MTVQRNIRAVNEAKARVKNHCMCARFSEDDRHYFVEYPPGFSVDGCRVSRGLGSAWALDVLLAKMEEHWQEAQL